MLLREGIERGVAAVVDYIQRTAVPASGKHEIAQIATVSAGDAAIGITILRHALEEPMRQIAVNAGVDGAVVIDTVRREQPVDGCILSIGYNATTGQTKDLVAAGIIDAAKVTRCALQNAASVATMILTTTAQITDIPHTEEQPQPAIPY